MLSGVASSCPAMLGSATLTMVVSSTCMMVAAITATAVRTRLLFIAASLQLHAHGRRCADAQGMVGAGGRELDADRHALGDLHPVAGGILWWQQREGGAGAAGDALHRAFEMLARVHVDLDVHVLAGVDADQFGFLIVGVDMEAVVGDESEQGNAHTDQRAFR